MFGWLKSMANRSRPASDGASDQGIPIDLVAIPGALEDWDGMPRPQWEVIRPAAASLSGRYEPHRVWCEVQRQWLEALVEALGGDYRIVETQSVLLLCCRFPDEAGSLARLCENTLSTVDSIVGAPAERCGKLPVFVFDSMQTYLTYISHFYAEGEHGMSGGVCVRQPGGDVHVATFEAPQALERSLAHEMVHVRLNPDLPQWVEEGCCETISRRVARSGPLLLDNEAVRKHGRYWGRHGLDSFWTGQAFGRPDRGQELSYALAEVLVNNLLNDHGRRFREFLGDAKATDCGEAAARNHFGLGLGELAGQFLGEGDWSPPAAAGEAS
jgi:hypothetical protein